MARSTLTTVKRIVWENLGVTNRSSGYGNLATNERYPAVYVDDKIAEADIETIELLFKNKQNTLLTEIYTTSGSLSSGAAVPQSWIIVGVAIDTVQAREISYGQYEMMLGGGIFDVTTYDEYYAIKDGLIYFFGTAAVIKYIDLTHPTTLSTLKSPSGFEGALANLASAKLLMKRGDKPEQAKFYKGEYDAFMQKFMIPDSNKQELVED